MRILTITNEVPYPLISGAPLRTYNVLRRLADEHEVYLICFGSRDEQREDIAHLLEFCQQVTVVRRKSLKKELWRVGIALKALLHGEPPELRLAFSGELAREIQDLVGQVEFDVVQIEHGSMGMYLEALPERLRRRSVWILHDIDFDKFKRLSLIARRSLDKSRLRVHATMMRRWQPNQAARYGLCVTMSEADRRLLLSANSNLKVEVSPNGVDTDKYRPLPEASSGSELLFIGNMGYTPNADAAAYFCGDILPSIKKAVADAKLWIVGINPGSAVRRLESSDVSVTGSVADVIPYYQRSRVCVVPLRAGSGTRLKILEAMALGRPVVSTSIGCEGLNVVHGEHILIADDATEFAAEVVKLLMHRDLRESIAKNAREFVVKAYDWEIITRKSASDFEKLVGCEQSFEGSGSKVAPISSV